MKEMTGATYQSSQYAKLLAVSEAKVGKTVFLVGGALGVLPWQTAGAIVDKPENLHVLTFDVAALKGIQRCLTETMKAPQSALAFSVYNMEDDFQKAAACENDYDMGFYDALFTTVERIKAKAKRGGVHAVLVSSLTGAAQGLERALMGPPQGKTVANQNKWAMLGHHLNELQHRLQQDLWHCIWEAHLTKTVTNEKDERGQPVEKDGIMVKGSAGKSWGYNVGHVLKVQRRFGKKHAGTNCDVTFFNTRATTDLVLNGRGANEALDAEEPCMTTLFTKLGYTVGGWRDGEAKAVVHVDPDPTRQVVKPAFTRRIPVTDAPTT